jgi:hypothetical protein
MPHSKKRQPKWKIENMITESLIKKYNQELGQILESGLPDDILLLIRKFDSRFKMQVNQHFSLRKNYFDTKFTKNQRSISHIFLEISSAWFCYEILILICKDYDLINQLFLVKDTRKKGNEFLVSFLKESNFNVNSSEIIKKFYFNFLSILDKHSNQKMKIAFLCAIKEKMQSLITDNKKIGKEDYNPCILSFHDEISEIERIYIRNYKKQLKNREEFDSKHIDFVNYIGLCYAIRNQYVHNGLTYFRISNNDNYFLQTLQTVKENLNHLTLTLAVAIFRTINNTKNI